MQRQAQASAKIHRRPLRPCCVESKDGSVAVPLRPCAQPLNVRERSRTARIDRAGSQRRRYAPAMRTPTLATIALTLAVAAPATSQRRIACLGDSITFGARIADRDHGCYPARLGARMPTVEARNFGVGGATLLRRADRPYMETEPWREALAWRPDVAVVVLGTNDTCSNSRRRNWEHAADLERDAQAMVEALLQVNPSMRILLASPPNMVVDQPGLNDARRQDLAARAPRIDRIAAALRAVSADRGDRVDHLDLRRLLRAREVVDGVHPNPFGADRLAQRIHEALQDTPERALPPLTRLPVAHEPDAFHDFDGVRFTLPESGASCRVFAPHVTASGAPWILRARFFGHEPALDLALLDRGFHLAYCDVAGLYGNDVALQRWDELHALLTAYGLGEEIVLEGMSRGGAPIVNWAAANPSKVAAIYGDNPVADFRSWPGGEGGRRREAEWRQLLAAYGLDEQGARDYAQMPVDRLAPIAAAQTPLLLVLGERDDVVPPAANGEELARRYEALGGPVTVWRKPDAGHHPHGLAPVDPLLRAILQATGRAAMPTTQATTSVEYRRGAGWGGDTWLQQVDKMRALAARHQDARVAMFGDSITQGLTGASDRVARGGGARPFDRAFGDLGAISLGLSGDRTEHLLARIERGALREFDPDVVVLQIGVNNVNAAGHTATETAAGVRAVVTALRRREPQAHVLVCGPFPGGERGSPVRRALDEVHADIATLGEGEHVTYLDLRPLFVDEQGVANQNMRPDRIHLSPAGVQAWLAAIEAPVRRLLAR